MEHRFNRKQCHTELATFIMQRSIMPLACPVELTFSASLATERNNPPGNAVAFN